METVFESNDVLIRINESGEPFILFKRTGAEVRIEPSAGIILAWDAFFTPTSMNGLSGFNVNPRR